VSKLSFAPVESATLFPFSDLRCQVQFFDKLLLTVHLANRLSFNGLQAAFSSTSLRANARFPFWATAPLDTSKWPSKPSALSTPSPRGMSLKPENFHGQ
jgi:hypothetical protein